MRIVAGQWRGRRIEAPRGSGTRPTSDRVREALFSSLTARLGSDLGAGPVLDLFAGSGALGFEALSRGASKAVLVDSDRSAQQVIKRNMAELGGRGRVTVIGADATGQALDQIARLGPFVLLFVDPPYRIDQAKVARVLTRLGAAGAVAFGAPVAWEHSAGSHVVEPDGYAIEKTYRYGDTSVTLLRYYGEEGAG